MYLEEDFFLLLLFSLTMRADNRLHYGPMVEFVCLHLFAPCLIIITMLTYLKIILKYFLDTFCPVCV